MYKSRYPWLKDMKESSKKKSGNIELTKITILGGSPISGRTDISFTGYGEDGQLQPNKPTGMFGSIGGSVMEHEGEARIEYPDGEKTVIPANQLNQDMLASLEKKTGMQGARTGGTFQPGGMAQNPVDLAQGIKAGVAQPSPMGGITPRQPQAQQPAQRPGMQTASLGGAPTSPTPGGPWDPFNKDKWQDLINKKKPIVPQPIDPGDVIKPIDPGVIIPQDIVGPDQIGPGDVIKPIDPGTIIPQDITVPRPAVHNQNLFATQPAVHNQNLLATQPITPPPDPEDKGSIEYQQALQRLKKYSDGISPVDQKIREEERMRLAGEEAAARMALEQQGAQLGLSQREMLMEQALLGREFGAQETALMAALRKGESDKAFQASMALPGATLAGMQMAFEKKKWEDMSDFEKQKWNWDKEAWQKQFDLSKEQWNKAFDFGKEKWDYQQKMDFASQLLQQGGPENYKKVSEMFKGMFGEGVDFTNALNEENYQNFGKGMNSINEMLANGLGADEIIEAMKKDGSYDMMKMDDDDLKFMINKMKLNSDPVYKAEQMVDQWVKQGYITEDQKDDFMALLIHQLTNPDGFDIFDAFVLKDKNGNEVGAFKTKEEMDKYIKDNPGEYQIPTDVTKNYIRPKGVGPGGGTGDGTGTGTDPITGPVDDVTTGLKGLLGRTPTQDEMKNFTTEDLEYLNAFRLKDYKDYGTEDLSGMYDLYKRMPKDYQDKNNFAEVVKKISGEYGDVVENIDNKKIVTGVELTEDEIEAIKNSSNPEYLDTYTAENIMDSFDNWREGTSVKNGWYLTPQAKKFVKQTTGKYFEYKGKMFKLVGSGTNKDSDRPFPYLKIYDPVTNKTYNVANPTGKKPSGITTWEDVLQEQSQHLTDNKEDNFINDYWNDQKG